MEHPHLDVLRRWFDAFERSDLDAARALIAPDAVLHVTEPRELAGDYVGFDEFLEFYSRKRATAGEGFTYRLNELLVGDASAAACLTLSAQRDGSWVEWKQIAVYQIANGAIRGMWFIEEEPQVQVPLPDNDQVSADRRVTDPEHP